MAKKEQEKSNFSRSNCKTKLQNQDNTPPLQDIAFNYMNTTSCIRQSSDNDNTPPRFQQRLYERSSKKPHTINTKLNYISNERKRALTFNKRSKGIMKKIIDLFLLTGAESLFIISEPGSNDIYTVGTDKFKALIRENDGFKNYIKKALNAQFHINNKNSTSEDK